MSATSGGGGSVSEGSETGGSSQSTMSASDSPSTSFQNNLAENVTKITLSEENGTDVTGSKINLSLDADRQQKDGIVNVAFDYEDETNRGGDFKSINESEKKDKVPEAVNLELVNMVPYSNGNGTSYGVPVNGIPMKKDSEQVDMSTPYDEYFVPVNEHKKYMRGEKLYVTKDKRRPTSWRRCLSWIVACTVISVVLIIAILAGTGVILSQEQNYIKEASVGRNFAGSNLQPSVTDKSLSPTAEMYMYVPRSIESEFVIDNLDFDPAFKDTNSSAYQQFANTMEDQLKMLLFDKETLEFGASDVGLKVVNVSRDPFKVNYRIGWNYKQGVNNPPEPIKMEDVKKRLVESLARNQGYIDKYHIDREAIKVNHVINSCQMDNGGCSHICYYNYITQEFTCTCPTHLVLDNGGKNCVAWTGPSEDDGVPVPSHTAYSEMPYGSTANPAHAYESGVHYEQETHHHFQNRPEDHSESSFESKSTDHRDEEHKHYEPTAEPVPETSAERDTSADSDIDHHHKNIHSIHEINGHDISLEPTAEPNIEDKYHSHAGHPIYESEEPVAEPTSESAPEPNSENGNSDHSDQFVYGYKERHKSEEPTPEPAPEPTTNPSAVGKTHDNSDHFEHGFKDHEPEAEPVAEPTTNPSAVGKTHDNSDHFEHGFKDHEPEAEPTAEPVPEPTTNPSAVGKTHDNSDHFEHGFKDHEPEAEPVAEPTTNPSAVGKTHDNSDHFEHGFKDHEPEAEPTAEPVPEPTTNPSAMGKTHDNSDHFVHRFKDHEPEAEPTAEPVPEPITDPSAVGKTHDNSNHFVHGFKDHEPEAKPTVEPTLEPFPGENPDSKQHESPGSAVKTHESSAEPTPEPALKPAAEEENDKKAHDQYSVYGSKDNEPLAEPTPEPAPEPSANENSEGTTNEGIGHSVYESKDHKPAAEPSSEPEPAAKPVFKGDVQDSSKYALFGSKDQEGSAEPTPEPGFESNTNNQSTVYESNDNETVPETTQKSDFKKKSELFSTPEQKNNRSILEVEAEANTELASKPTPESSPKSDSSDSKDNTYRETTVHPEHHENIKYNYDSSENQNPKLNISQGNSDSKPEYAVEVHSPAQTESNKENKSQESVPYLQDILIAKPSLNSESQNATGQTYNALDNVERTANGEPVIEEIIIEKSDTKSEGQARINSSHPVMQGHVTNKSDSNSTNPVVSDGHIVTVIDHSGDSLTTKSAEHYGDSHTQGIQTEVATDHPKTEYSIPRIEKSDNGQSLDTKESVINSGDQDSSLSSHNLSTGTDSRFDNMPINSDAEKKPINPVHENLSVTTVQSEIQHESHTVPVYVELSDQNKKFYVQGIPKQENQTDTHDYRVTEGPNEAEHHITPDTNSIHESSQPSIHITAPESQPSMTTLPPFHAPRGVEKTNEQLTDDEDTDERKIQIKDKVNLKQNETEGNESKSHEEISNNIKDELLDNEEFNTLIDKEYNNKETATGGGKDTTNKYSNKSLKTEKKKLKDYIKGEKTDSDKKSEITARPGVIPEDFILQKHVNGNENTFDLDYSLQNEHTTKHDGGVTVIDPHGIEGVPGVSFKPHGINNHDISVLQTVAPDFKLETVFPGGVHELETLKPDFKAKQPDNKDLDSKLDKEYKFDKDYKYEKQKVSKKKDLKKKVGGKDGKNVELDEGRKYFTKDNWDASQEVEDVFETTMNPSLEKITVHPDTDIRISSGSPGEVTTISESSKVKISGSETTLKPGLGTNTFEVWTKMHEDGITEQSDFKPIKEIAYSDRTKIPELATRGFSINLQDSDNKPVDENGHLMIDEPSVKSTFNVSPGTVYDGQMSTAVNLNDSGIKDSVNSNVHGSTTTLGTVFDGIHRDTIATNAKVDSAQATSGQNSTFLIYENTPSIPKIMPVEAIDNFTTADPTIIINGQSGNLQNGHIVRFANTTLHGPNATVISIFNGTLSHPDGHSFSFTNYTATFPNGSAVQPTIVVHGQSGALQDGHEIRFGNSTFQSFATPSTQQTGNKVFMDSNVYRIENVSIPGTVFDGHFNPQDGHYHMFTNASGTFVYTNSSTPPAFIISGQSGDFGNATAYVIGNNTSREFSEGFAVPHSVIFRNSTVFAVENTNPSEMQFHSREMTSNETIHFTRQMSPSFVSSGTAYKVNNYFGYISKCAAGQFQCLNGTSKRGSACISLSSKCDSINDCSDGSDEMGCIENGCPGNFQCSDNTCLKRNLVCNGILDCSDGSDEKNCESWKCEFDEFQCPSGRCIPVVWQCDNKPDCDNHTDEYNCQTSCGNDEYLCPEGWCIPLTYKCNGIKECSNGEDEQLCDCSHEEFKCQTGGCVSMNQVCNGVDDCPDRSDEWDCAKLEPDSNLLKIRSPSGNFEPVCADNWSSKYSDEVCAFLGYFSSIPIDNENSSVTTEKSFYVLKNDTTADFNRKITVNLEKSEGNCSSGKLVKIICQEFSCGSRSMTDSSSVEARLVGGMSATAGQWPSVALIYNIRNFHSCTANVLTPRWVLASYNCLKMGNKNLNEQDWKFFGGSTVFEAERDNAETRKILSIIPHPQVKFNQFLFTNDLALVELEQSLQFTSNLGAVCLPEQEIQPRQICVAAGWGMNTPEDKTIRQQLQYLPVPTMNLTECNSTEHYSGFITEDKICAGYNSAQKSLCYNEEGAPLMCVNDRGEWELQGVLSYHSNCGRGSHPSIFSSITPVKDWIKKTIRNNFERKTSALTKR